MNFLTEIDDGTIP